MVVARAPATIEVLLPYFLTTLVMNCLGDLREGSSGGGLGRRREAWFWEGRVGFSSSKTVTCSSGPGRRLSWLLEGSSDGESGKSSVRSKSFLVFVLEEAALFPEGSETEERLGTSEWERPSSSRPLFGLKF